MDEFDSIDRYETIQLLGRGGMGSVYLARDPLIDRYVAVKVLDVAVDAGSRGRFVREARSAGRLHHPNIVTIFDVGEHRDRPFIAMEYVPGHTLATLIEQGRLALGEKLRLVADACAALAYAHRAGVVHLDVKPANLIRHDSGVLKVLDFGIARLLTTDSAQTQQIMGTLRYMAPEQVTGQPLDRRADVFALGCVLYEVIAGAPMFKGTMSELLSRATKPAPTPSLAGIAPEVHPELVRMIQRAIATDPGDRYDDLEGLRREIDALRGRLDPAPDDATRIVVPWEAAPAAPGAGDDAITRTAAIGRDRETARRTTLPRPHAVRFESGRWRLRGAYSLAAIGLLGAAGAGLWQFRAGDPDVIASRPAATAVDSAPLPLTPAAPEARAASPEPPPASGAAVSGPPVGADVEKEVWRLLARRDRTGVNQLLRSRRAGVTPRLLGELVADARSSASTARLNADGRGESATSSPAYRSGVDTLTRAEALRAQGSSVDAIAAFWTAADRFEAAAAAEPPRLAETSAPATPPASKAAVEPSPAAPTPAAPSAGAPAPVKDARASTSIAAPTAEESIRAALSSYEAAYDARDAAALRRIAPGLTAEQLDAIGRTFAEAISYNVELTIQSMNVTGTTATATCMVTHAFVPRIGSASRNAPLQTRFHLRQSAAGWVIDRIERAGR